MWCSARTADSAQRMGRGRQVLDLTTLSSAEGFIIQGDAQGDTFGHSVWRLRAMSTGTGLRTSSLGAPFGRDGGAEAGEAYVVFGSNSGFGTTDGTGRQVLDLTTLSSAEGFIIQGDVAGDQAGRSVSSAGDVNGDGLEDLIVGARGAAGQTFWRGLCGVSARTAGSAQPMGRAVRSSIFTPYPRPRASSSGATSESVLRRL